MNASTWKFSPLPPLHQQRSNIRAVGAALHHRFSGSAARWTQHPHPDPFHLLWETLKGAFPLPAAGAPGILLL